MSGIKALQTTRNTSNSMRLIVTLLGSFALSACSSSSSSDITDASDALDDVVVLPAQEVDDADILDNPIAEDDGSNPLDTSIDEDTLVEDELVDEGVDEDALIPADSSDLDDDIDSDVPSVIAPGITPDGELVGEELVNEELVDENVLEDEGALADSDAVPESDDELLEEESSFTPPTSFTSVNAAVGAAISNTEVVSVQSALGVQNPFTAQVFDFSSNEDGTILGVQQFRDNASVGSGALPGSETNVDHFAVDVNTLAIDALFQTNLASSGALSDDFTQLALSESCQAFSRRVGSGSVGTLVNQLTLANVCFTEASISTNGDTAVFTASPAALSANGTTVPADGFDSASGPIVVHRPSGTVTGLTQNNIVIPGTLTSVYNFSHAVSVDVSADGSTVAARLQFIPNVQSGFAVVEVLNVILVVDAASGQTTAIDQQFTQQLICSSCETTSAFDLVVSGDGQRIIFARPSDDELTTLNADSVLFVHDMGSAETTALSVEDGIEIGTLAADGSASQVAFVNTAGVPVLLNLDSGVRINMDNAIRGCDPFDAEDCDFDSYEFNTSQPLDFNVSGTTLSMLLVPVSSAKTEGFLLDTVSLSLNRLAPNRLVTSIAVDAAGDNVAYSSIDDAASDSLQSEIFLIRR